jgi:hypothetical protein
LKPTRKLSGFGCGFAALRCIADFQSARRQAVGRAGFSRVLETTRPKQIFNRFPIRRL